MLDSFALHHVAGHLGFILAGLAYLCRDMVWLRTVAIFGSCADITYAFFEGPLWLVIYWSIFFIAVNTGHIALTLRERTAVAFTPDEQELHETMFRGFSALEFMKLLRAARWRSEPVGSRLISQGEYVPELLLISNGEVAVHIGGREVARLRDGSFAGEMSFLNEGPASADVIVTFPCKILAWPKEELRALLRRNPALQIGLQGLLGADLAKKLADTRGNEASPPTEGSSSG